MVPTTALRLVAVRDQHHPAVGNARAGVEVKAGGNPTLRRNRINNNGYEAIWVYEHGGGTIEDNDLRNNERGAWDISEDSEPNLKRARNLE